ncbi:hypothetical protein V6N13_121976 [Hibiscus sabdariffa]|uniref:Uncharacterized protein n=1 Tax=Hibiscus sabdariffa TaxID=183260 RepID=A0ABR1ZDB4_9ROSI
MEEESSELNQNAEAGNHEGQEAGQEATQGDIEQDPNVASVEEETTMPAAAGEGQETTMPAAVEEGQETIVRGKLLQPEHVYSINKVHC